MLGHGLIAGQHVGGHRGSGEALAILSRTLSTGIESGVGLLIAGIGCCMNGFTSSFPCRLLLVGCSW